MEQLRPALRLPIKLLECGERDGVLRLCFVDGAVLHQRVVDSIYFLDEDSTESKAKRRGDLAIAGVFRRGDCVPVRGNQILPAPGELSDALDVGLTLGVARGEISNAAM